MTPGEKQASKTRQPSTNHGKQMYRILQAPTVGLIPEPFTSPNSNHVVTTGNKMHRSRALGRISRTLHESERDVLKFHLLGRKPRTPRDLEHLSKETKNRKSTNEAKKRFFYRRVGG